MAPFISTSIASRVAYLLCLSVKKVRSLRLWSAKVVFERHGAAMKQHHVSSSSVARSAPRLYARSQQRQRIATAMLDPPAEKNVAALEIDAGDVGRQRGQPTADLFDQFGRQGLVGVETHDPFGRNGEIVERPLKLQRVVDEFVRDDERAAAPAISAVRSVKSKSTMKIRPSRPLAVRSSRGMWRSSFCVRTDDFDQENSPPAALTH